MKIVVIGDIHGRGDWKKIIKDNPDSDKIVFIGDYFDSFDIPAAQQKNNFKEIIAYKKKNKDKVVLLFGNHEFHYLKTSTQTYGGHQGFQHIDIGELLNKAINEDLIQMCYIHDNIIFSHAGVTKTWCKSNDIGSHMIEYFINYVFRHNPNAFKLIEGGSGYRDGDDPYQSPIWVRPNSLIYDKIDGYKQVVGHTEKAQLTIGDDITFIDTLGRSGQYLIIKDGVMSVSEDLTEQIMMKLVLKHLNKYKL